MIRKMGNFNVTQRTKDSFFNATELLKQWNSVEFNPGRDLSRFWEQQNTKMFIIANECKFVKSRASRGDNAGTWMDEKLINRFYEWLSTNNIGYMYSKERLFFDNIETISGIKLERQYRILDYKIDAVTFETIENCGEFDSDKDFMKKIICFEFDEYYHTKQIESDIKRQSEIVFELKKEFDIVEIYRIPENKSNIFLRYAIPYFGLVETSYTSQKLFEYVFRFDRIIQFDELINEMRRMWHLKHNTL